MSYFQNNLQIKNEHCFQNVCLLKNGKIAALGWGTLIIFNEKSFKIENNFYFGEHILQRGFSQLSDSNIIIWGHSVVIYKIKDNSFTLLYKLKIIANKVIEAKNKKLISVTQEDKTLKIWEFQKSKKNYICIDTIVHGLSIQMNIEFIKENEFIFMTENVIRFYEVKKNNINKISHLDIKNNKCFLKKNNLGFLMSNEKINVIDLNKRKLLYIYKPKDPIDILSTCYLTNGNIIIVGFIDKEKYNSNYYRLEILEFKENKFKQIYKQDIFGGNYPNGVPVIEDMLLLKKNMKENLMIINNYNIFIYEKIS